MAASGTHVFRVALRDRPSVHRDVEIGSAASLAKLAEAIVRAFDFKFDHAFGFYAETQGRSVMRGRPAYELFADMGEETEARSVRKTRIGDAFREVGQAMTFLFDYGDEWLFRVEVIALARTSHQQLGWVLGGG
jgi:hypothetical protein